MAFSACFLRRPFLQDRPLWTPVLGLLTLLALGSCGTIRAANPPRSPQPPPLSSILLGDELRAAAPTSILGPVRYSLPIESNSWVESELNYLAGDRADLMASWMERGAFYRPFVQKVLEENGLPADLFYLAMIESGYVPTARSHVGATGLWQFMPATARDVGLRLDDYVDERLDPIRSTRAAALHLRSLIRIHGDWALATAAYNAGSGRIRRGLRDYETDNFWELAQRGDLAEETRRYVPRLYAVTIIGRDTDRFGIALNPTTETLTFDSVYVDRDVALADLATATGVGRDLLQSMNPHFIRGIVPSGYWVWVPANLGSSIQRAFLASDLGRGVGLGSYTVRWGDTLSRIATDAGITSARVRELNPGTDFDRLMAGARISLPANTVERIAEARDAQAAAEVRESEPPVAAVAGATVTEPLSRPRSHRVEWGETLGAIANRYAVTVAELKRVNGLEDDRIIVGMELQLPGEDPEETTGTEEVVGYTVQAGDTLSEIARDYGSTVAAISEANNLGERQIQPGQLLMIPRRN